MHIRPFNPQVLRLFLTNKCVYECAHCLMRSSPRESAVMPEADIARYLQLGKELGIKLLSLVGGEPFTCPEEVSFAIRTAREFGYKIAVESAFLGKTEAEIAKNVTLLKENYCSYLTSIHIYQRRSCPLGLDYIQNKVLSLRHLAENEVKTKLTIIGAPEAHETEALFEAIMDKGLSAKVYKWSDDLRSLMSTPYAYIIPRANGKSTQIDFKFQKIMAVGRAYDTFFAPDEATIGDVPENQELDCFHLELGPDGKSKELDQILIHPDGKVQICCQQEGGTDFGFGNLKREDYSTVAHRISAHPMIQYGLDYTLFLIRFIVEDSFPQLIPAGGFRTGCDICNLYYRTPALREETTRRFKVQSGLEKLSL